ncbi:MAG TPA: CocE/NonD family hydrolase C-terminal non-catalytic domain-containing protein, partial [Bacteroidales bacterium]|nr:CocE/NonD family hydrolase C-terminal non-catalytic domain-containing protein [Bacteroidales bacterium]
TSDTSLITPGEIYPLTITLPDVAQTFPAGHRIRLDITSSNYPRFHRNINDGGPLYEPGDTLTAMNRIYHNADYPSLLRIPVNSSVGKPSQKAQGLNLYPNPLGKTQKLHIEGLSDNTIRVYNLCGRLIKTLQTEHRNQSIQHNLPRGMYIIKSGNASQKLMVR